MANEMQLINATPIKKFIENGLNCKDPLKAFGHDAIEILAEIEFAPVVDAVEVVRCWKCRYCFDGACLHPKNRVAMKVPDFGEHYVYLGDLVVQANHHCGYGERRAENGK